MNYQQLQDYALQCSLEHHLCNVHNLMTDGSTVDDILSLLEDGSNEPVIWANYEYTPREDLVELVEDLGGVHLHNFMEVLTQVNGADWVANFKEGK